MDALVSLQPEKTVCRFSSDTSNLELQQYRQDQTGHLPKVLSDFHGGMVAKDGSVDYAAVAGFDAAVASLVGPETEAARRVPKTLRMGAGFSLDDLRAEQPPQMLQRGQSRYEIELAELPQEIAEAVPGRVYRSGVVNEKTGECYMEAAFEPESKALVIWSDQGPKQWSSLCYNVTSPMCCSCGAYPCWTSSTEGMTT
eukprot:1353440-Amphidinium_carterae.2